MKFFDHEVKTLLSMKQLVAARNVADLVNRIVKNAEFVKQDVATLVENFKLLEDSLGSFNVAAEELLLIKILVVESHLHAPKGIRVDF